MSIDLQIIQDKHSAQVILSEALAKKFKGIKRILCIVNEHHKFHLAIKHSKDGYSWIGLSKPTLKAIKHDIKKIEIIEDHSPLQFYESPVLNEILASDPEAQEKFNQLTDGKKRSIIYPVYKIKSIDKKIEKALLFAENLKRGYSNLVDMGKRHED